jgi:hypothetical protein
MYVRATSIYCTFLLLLYNYGSFLYEEVKKIGILEEINGLDSSLSDDYSQIILKFEMRKLTKVAQLISYNNPKAFEFTKETKEWLNNLSESSLQKLNSLITSHTNNLPF